MICPNCGREVIDGASFCPYCGYALSTSSLYITSADEQNSQNIQTKAYRAQNEKMDYGQPRERMNWNNHGQNMQYYPYPAPKTKKSHLGTIIGIIILILFLIMLFSIINQVTPNQGGAPTPWTGTIKFRYNSIWGNDVKIYIDGEYEGTVSSDQYHSFYGISPGTHTVEVRDTNDNFLARKTVEVNAGETTTVDLSWGQT